MPGDKALLTAEQVSDFEARQAESRRRHDETMWQLGEDRRRSLGIG